MVPVKFWQGDTVIWTERFEGISPDAWRVKYYFKGPGLLSSTASKSGDAFKTELLGLTTKALKPGFYKWQAVGTAIKQQGSFLLGDSKTLKEGHVVVEASLQHADADYDPRSHAKKTLDALEAVIEKRATSDELSYSIGNRSLSRMSYSELLSFRAKYLALYRQEQRLERGQGLRRYFIPRLGG